ncbi:MAG: hypothetical protein ACI9KE_000783 [Polyangiales bacterium]
MSRQVIIEKPPSHSRKETVIDLALCQSAPLRVEALNQLRSLTRPGIQVARVRSERFFDEGPHRRHIVGRGGQRARVDGSPLE